MTRHWSMSAGAAWRSGWLPHRTSTPPPGPRDDDEVREVQEAWISVPRGNSCKRIAAENEEKLRRPPAEVMQRPQRVLRVRAALAYELHVRDVAFGTVFDGQDGKREALIDACPRLEQAQRLIVRRNQHDLFERHRRARGVCCIEVTDVNGIERAAENAKPRALHAAGTGTARTAAIWRHMASRSSSRPVPATAEIR